MPIPSTRRTLAACILGFLLLGSMASHALSKLYSYDDSGAPAGWFQAGSGTFCLDVGSELGNYQASSFAGSGPLLGSWGGVSFRANFGSQPSIVISNLVGAAIITSFPATGGGEIAPDGVASDEWANFIARAATQGIIISEIGVCVPDPGSTFLMTVGGLGALTGLARANRSRRSRTTQARPGSIPERGDNPQAPVDR